MRSLIEQQEKIASEKRLGLMTHIVIGYPDLETSARMIEQMAENGVDFIELQIPFSDPIADGATIMKASCDALETGISTKDCMAFMAEMSKRVEIPLLFMSYFNILFAYGVEEFCRDAREAGAQGLIIPDMPREEEAHEKFYQAAAAADLPVIPVLAPKNLPERIKELSGDGRTLMYLPSRTGVTGARSEVADHLEAEISKVKTASQAPVAVGFGISQAGHIDILRDSGADIAVVGSALIDAFEANGLEGTERLLGEISSACRK